MIGCTRKHSCDADLQQNLLRHNYHTTPALAPERPACWSRLQRLVQLSCETRSVPCHTHHRSCHLVSRAPYCGGGGDLLAAALTLSLPSLALCRSSQCPLFGFPSCDLAGNPCKPQLHVKWKICRDWCERPGINPEPPVTSRLSRVFAPHGCEAAMPAVTPVLIPDRYPRLHNDQAKDEQIEVLSRMREEFSTLNWSP